MMTVACAGRVSKGSGETSHFTGCGIRLNKLSIRKDVLNIISNYLMITAGQLRASRALLGIDQRTLAEAAGLSLPTIQRMEASEGVIRGNVDSLMKLVGALDGLGIELITDNAASQAGGRGVRLKRPPS
jgi:DNA-binding XRE family transcriptional regulator